jgi:pyruvate,orthophosphate dikinase
MGNKSDIVGFENDAIDSTLAELKAAGLIEYDGFIVPTSSGFEALDQWYATDRGELSDATRAALIQEFHPLDVELKRSAGAWQEAVARDDWDARLNCIEALSILHSRANQFIDRFAISVPRFVEFQKRLETAMTLVLDGEVDHFVGVRCDSYHTIWFHFHEDLLRLLQRERDSES